MNPCESVSLAPFGRQWFSPLTIAPFARSGDVEAGVKFPSMRATPSPPAMAAPFLVRHSRVIVAGIQFFARARIAWRNFTSTHCSEESVIPACS